MHRKGKLETSVTDAKLNTPTTNHHRTIVGKGIGQNSESTIDKSLEARICLEPYFKSVIALFQKIEGFESQPRVGATYELVTRNHKRMWDGGNSGSVDQVHNTSK